MTEQENAVQNVISEEKSSRKTEINSATTSLKSAQNSQEAQSSEPVEKNTSNDEPIGPLAGKTCSIASLGCPKNLVDGETMVGRLAGLGLELTPNAEKVDVFLLNTCGFLRSARDEAVEGIRDALAEKEAGNLRFLIVSGCAVASDGEELARLFPNVDAWLSPFDEARLGDVVLELFAENPATEPLDSATAQTAGTSNAADDSAKTLPILTPDEYLAAQKVETKTDADAASNERPARFFYQPARNLTLDDSGRMILTAPNVAYLKIADGCDRFCSYCAIPKIRGRFVSKPLEKIVDEAEWLASQGVRELVLIAQETTFWGNDLYGEPRLARLLATLKEKNWFDWIRVLYTYPLFWSDELISLFKMEESGTTSVLPYVDVPLQHCNSALLKKMNRRVDKAQTEELLARLREEIPGVVLRTSLIVGFPGETDAEYQELVDFMEKWKFERAGIFEFSAEPRTPAAALDGQVDPTIKARRLERLYAKQERISRKFARGFIGKTLDVTLDSPGLADDGTPMRNVCLGRTFADAPDVDPIVYVTGRDLEVGTLTRCEIVDAQGLDLIAVPADPKKIFVSKSERKDAFERADRENGVPLPKTPKKGATRTDSFANSPSQSSRSSHFSQGEKRDDGAGKKNFGKYPWKKGGKKRGGR